MNTYEPYCYQVLFVNIFSFCLTATLWDVWTSAETLCLFHKVFLISSVPRNVRLPLSLAAELLLDASLPITNESLKSTGRRGIVSASEEKGKYIWKKCVQLASRTRENRPIATLGVIHTVDDLEDEGNKVCKENHVGS